MKKLILNVEKAHADGCITMAGLFRGEECHIVGVGPGTSVYVTLPNSLNPKEAFNVDISHIEGWDCHLQK